MKAQAEQKKYTEISQSGNGNFPQLAKTEGVVPFIILQLIALVLVFIFPELVTWLPSTVFKPL